MRQFVHISFASADFSQSALLLKASAAKHGVTDLRVYGVASAPFQEACKRSPPIMRQARGAGYWLWKPYIILDALRSVPRNTAVLYSDIAVMYARNPRALLDYASQPITLFNNDPNNIQSAWTKRDCFIVMNADREEYWSRRQLDAAFQLYWACPQSIEFVEYLLRCMSDPRALTDMPNVCGRPNFHNFINHRHDQSVLTIAAQQAGLQTYRPPSTVSPRDDDASYPQVFFHHRRRDRARLRFWPRYLLGLYDETKVATNWFR